jgi:homoserine kinase
LKDPVLFGKSICDRLIEPYRKEMIPNFMEVKNAALEAGAYGCSIAGGGPSLFAIGEKPIKIGKAMADAFKDVGVNSNTYITKTSLLGAEVL